MGQIIKYVCHIDTKINRPTYIHIEKQEHTQNQRKMKELIRIKISMKTASWLEDLK